MLGSQHGTSGNEWWRYLITRGPIFGRLLVAACAAGNAVEGRDAVDLLLLMSDLRSRDSLVDLRLSAGTWSDGACLRERDAPAHWADQLRRCRAVLIGLLGGVADGRCIFR